MAYLKFDDVNGNIFPAGNYTDGFTKLPLFNCFKTEAVNVITSSTSFNGTASGASTATYTLSVSVPKQSDCNGVSWYPAFCSSFSSTGDGYLEIQDFHLESFNSSGATLKVKIANQSASVRSFSNLKIYVVFIRKLDNSTGGIANIGND